MREAARSLPKSRRLRGASALVLSRSLYLPAPLPPSPLPLPPPPPPRAPSLFSSTAITSSQVVLRLTPVTHRCRLFTHTGISAVVIVVSGRRGAATQDGMTIEERYWRC
ncbi:Protein of unknown function [Gryllus bimaculatus]|nr:Protein of unknown function [Gryllus bimaculatus]